jgi:hypothetical protein
VFAQVEETLSTLSYATRTKNIHNRPTVQYDPREAQISLLRREIELLRQENTLLKEQLRTGTGAGGEAASHAVLAQHVFADVQALPSKTRNVHVCHGRSVVLVSVLAGSVQSSVPTTPDGSPLLSGKRTGQRWDAVLFSIGCGQRTPRAC